MGIHKVSNPKCLNCPSMMSTCTENLQWMCPPRVAHLPEVSCGATVAHELRGGHTGRVNFYFDARQKYLPLFSIRVATQEAFMKRLFFRTSQQTFFDACQCLTRVKNKRVCVAAALLFAAFRVGPFDHVHRHKKKKQDVWREKLFWHSLVPNEVMPCKSSKHTQKLFYILFSLKQPLNLAKWGTPTRLCTSAFEGNRYE